MIPEIGHILLILTFVASILQVLFWCFNIKKSDDITINVLIKSTFINFVFILFSFGILVYSFIISDFSLVIVSDNSHTLKPLIYKISGTWGNHEGSLMLWILILSFFTFLVSRKKHQIPYKLLSSIIGIQTIILCLFLSGLIIYYSIICLKEKNSVIPKKIFSSAGKKPEATATAIDQALGFIN